MLNIHDTNEKKKKTFKDTIKEKKKKEKKPQTLYPKKEKGLLSVLLINEEKKAEQ